MKRLFSIFTIILLFVFCEKYQSEPEPNTYISMFNFPDTIYAKSSYEFIVEAKLENRNPDRIYNVNLYCEPLSSIDVSFNLYDSDSCDIINGDGIYTQKINSEEFADYSGKYTAVVTVGSVSQETDKKSSILKSSLFINTSKLSKSKEFVILDEKKNSPPEISDLTYPQSVSIDSFQNDLLTVKVTDADGYEDISNVLCHIYYPLSAVWDLKLELNDTGIDGDSSAGDFIFSLLLTPEEIAQVGRGDYSFLIFALDKKNNKSNQLFGEIEYYTSAVNLPPEIIQVNAPDTVFASGNFLLLSAEVNDPDGLADIDRVMFNSYKPDGNPASGNPFYLYDDGGEIEWNGITSGDAIKNDGIYTIKVVLPATVMKGTYHFIFEAHDKAGNISNKIDHSLTVK